MKKIFVLFLAALFIVPLTASAQKTTVTHINRNKTYRTITTVKPQRKVWYQGEVDLGFAFFGEDETKTTGPMVETIHGVRINKHVFIGAGIGLHYPIGGDDDVYVPIFADFKVFCAVNRKVSPFLNIDAGYEPCVGGFYFNTSLGLKYKRWQFSVGVRGHNVDYSESGYFDGNYYYHEDIDPAYFGYVKVGFTF